MTQHYLTPAERDREIKKELDELKEKSLSNLQKLQKEWSEKNFGKRYGSGYRPLLGAMEELGELAHAHLKKEQGIRNHEDHDANAKDAIADVIIYLMDYCNNQEWNIEEILFSTLKEVLKRDWKKDKNFAYKGNK